MREYLMAMFRSLKNEKGQGLVEYALIIALIAILLIGALTAMEGGIAAAFARITAVLNP